MIEPIVDLMPGQQEVIDAGQTSFLLGAAGTGKSTALQQRLIRLLEMGEPAYTILVILAEPDHAPAYLGAVHQAGPASYADLKITTYNKMAQEMVELFWPLVARPSGFDKPYQPPRFLTYDLAQLLMWHVITPMLREGAFADLRLRPQQIVSQLLDTLNRAALNGLSLAEAIDRQKKTWAGEVERIVHLEDAAQAARAFRQSCLDNSLLDLSLAVRVFDTQLVHHETFKNYFQERYRHLIVDNIEEQTPAGQNFVRELMDVTQTTAVAFDSGGGYKRFLAADPNGARSFYHASAYQFQLEESFTTTQPLVNLSNLVENFLLFSDLPTTDAGAALWGEPVYGRYRREMVQELTTRLSQLLAEEDLLPRDIAIIAPYLDGALRYMLAQAFKEAGLPFRELRRRSSPRDEPRVRAWLTWLALARPEWNVAPTSYDVAEALTLSIAGIDPARAALLADRLYQPDSGQLLPATELPDRLVERIGIAWVDLVETLRLWLAGTEPDLPLDHFLHELFQLLSQPEFQPKPDIAGAAVCDWLVKAATRLRQAAGAMGLNTPAEIGVAFIDGIHNGLVTANPPELGDPPDPDGIMISTIYGYLLGGAPVKVQVWLETAASGWWDIPNQPLSNAFVLAQSYDPEQAWTMDQDFKIRNELLSRIIRGLTSRCTGGILLATSDLDRRGVRQEGPLWRALQPIRNAR